MPDAILYLEWARARKATSCTTPWPVGAAAARPAPWRAAASKRVSCGVGDLLGAVFYRCTDLQD